MLEHLKALNTHHKKTKKKKQQKKHFDSKNFKDITIGNQQETKQKNKNKNKKLSN
jgi:hypothetical protein